MCFHDQLNLCYCHRLSNNRQTVKVDEKQWIMIRNRNNQIPHPVQTPNGKGTHTQLRRYKIKKQHKQKSAMRHIDGDFAQWILICLLSFHLKQITKRSNICFLQTIETPEYYQLKITNKFTRGKHANIQMKFSNSKFAYFRKSVLASILNSWGNKFTNISKNLVLANISELTVSTQILRFCGILTGSWLCRSVLPRQDRVYTCGHSCLANRCPGLHAEVEAGQVTDRQIIRWDRGLLQRSLGPLCWLGSFCKYLNPKNSDTQWTVAAIIIKFGFCGFIMLKVMCPKDADAMTNIPFFLIWVYTICSACLSENLGSLRHCF